MYVVDLFTNIKEQIFVLFPYYFHTSFCKHIKQFEDNLSKASNGNNVQLNTITQDFRVAHFSSKTDKVHNTDHIVKNLEKKQHPSLNDCLEIKA